MSIRIFALTTRGLEELSAHEMALLPGLEIIDISYRRITANFSGDIHSLVSLLTVDDAFIDLGHWTDIAPQRTALADIQDRSMGLQMKEAIRTIRQVRSLPPYPVFSVTANFVGKRNYSYLEIKEAVSHGINGSTSWRYSEDDNLSDLNFRVFIEHQVAYIGLRLAKHSLQKRWYKNAHVTGSLKPPIAAAMVNLALESSLGAILDPFCGAGTILIEAGLRNSFAMGGDSNKVVLSAARENAASAGMTIALNIWDAHRLPFGNNSIEKIVTNLPWGRQISLGTDLKTEYKKFCTEFHRILHPQGMAVLLTLSPELLVIPGFRIDFSREISLFGQNPTLLVFKPDL